MIRLFVMFLSIIVTAGIVLVVMQSPTWKTGRVSSDPLDLVNGGPEVARPGRLWIDTDAACGVTPGTDPDDCLAIVWLASRGFDIIGISTSFGNASGGIVEQTVKSLVAKMTQNGMPTVPVWKGLAGPQSSGEGITEPGVTELRVALKSGPLTILAIGPLTNVAAALEGRPDLQRNVSSIVAVMGHRPGHLFHPSEGNGSGAMFGHGPIFRDLNLSTDPDAAKQVLAMNLALVLIPYDAAKSVMITGKDLDRLSVQGAVFRNVAEKARGWLGFWNKDIGLPGFYPFDWVAASYLANPNQFGCAQIKARVSWEWAFWLIPQDALLIGDISSGVDEESNVRYCPQSAPSVHDFLLSSHTRLAP